MAQVNLAKEEDEILWYLDLGCSNHMCGNREWFVEFDDKFRQHVKLGDDRRMQVEGKGSLRLEINGIIQVISSVYFISGLRNNMLSIGQLQQKGLRITIEDDMCEVWHKQQKRVLMYSKMFTNRMFVIFAKLKKPRGREVNQVLSTMEAEEEMWHCRYGNLNRQSLVNLAEKQMVTGLPKLKSGASACDVCMKGKQNREITPKQSLWKASRGLELVHSDIYGPISPM